MGNHAAGKAMGTAAKAALKALKGRKPSQEEALELLDSICEPWRNCDAEFESDNGDDFVSYDDPNGPLGELIGAALAPERDWRGELDAALRKARSKGEVVDYDEEPVCVAWFSDNGPRMKFKRRYDFW